MNSSFPSDDSVVQFGKARSTNGSKGKVSITLLLRPQPRVNIAGVGAQNHYFITDLCDFISRE